MSASKSRKKLCFVGNCQTTFMSNLIKHHDFPVTQIDAPEAYLAKKEDKQFFLEKYEEADVIVTRLMNDRIEDFVSTKWINDQYPNKVVIIPNIYFNGLDPDLCRIYNSKFNVVRGPLGDYSCNMIHFAFMKGWSIDECVSLMKRNDIIGWYEDSVAKSLAAQRSREKICDITISDYIEQNYRARRLFYTFNHPTNEILIELFKRLMERIGIEDAEEWEFDRNFLESNSLSYVVSPIHPAIIQHYELKFDCSGFEYKTIFSDLGENPVGKLNYRYLSSEDLARVFFERYDSEGLRLEQSPV